MDFCCLMDMFLPPNRLFSNPPISLGWVATLSTNLVDILLSLSRLASNPHTNLVWVVTISATMGSTAGFSCQWGLVTTTPLGQILLDSTHQVLVEAKLFYIHACFTLGRGYHN